MENTDRRSRARNAFQRAARDNGLPTELTILSERWNTVARLGDSGVIGKCATLADMVRIDPLHWFQQEVDVCATLSSRGVPVQTPYISNALLVNDFPVTLWHEVEGEMGECSEEQLIQSLARVHEFGADLLSDRPWFATITSHFDDVFPVLKERNTIPRESLDLLKVHYNRLLDRIVSANVPDRFIHGDAQRKNAMRTDKGAIWIDFEECSYGPVAWDLACLTMHRRFSTDRVLDRYAELQGEPRISDETVDLCKQLRELEGLTWMLAIQDEREPGFRDEAKKLLQDVLRSASVD